MEGSIVEPVDNLSDEENSRVAPQYECDRSVPAVKTSRTVTEKHGMAAGDRRQETGDRREKIYKSADRYQCEDCGSSYATMNGVWYHRRAKHETPAPSY